MDFLLFSTRYLTQTWEAKFHISGRPCIILSIYIFSSAFQDIKLVAESKILNIMIFKYYWSANLASKLLNIYFQFTVYVSNAPFTPTKHV